MYCSPTTWRRAPDCESTMGASSWMVMLVVAVATESVKRRVAGTSTSRLTPSWGMGAKPPGGTRVNWNLPCSSVVVCRVQCVAVLASSTAAFGITEPEGSATVPITFVVGASWARAGKQARTNKQQNLMAPQVYHSLRCKAMGPRMDTCQEPYRDLRY